MSNGRADKGGQVGVNGATYQGGQFLPSTQTEKGAHKSRKAKKTGRMKIGPDEWAIPELENVASLYAQFIVFVSPWDLKEGRITVNAEAARYYGHTPAEIAALAQRWLNGERWIAIKEN